MAGIQGFNFFKCDLIVASYHYFLTQFSKVLDQVVGKRVIVIEHEQHGNTPAKKDGSGAIK
jgi:hypothetical protein